MCSRIVEFLSARILLVCAVIPLLTIGAISAPAVAAPRPTTPLVTAKPLPTWQTNGTVWTVHEVGGVMYVGGNFTAVRPPGAAVGENEVARKNMAAFDSRTGALLPFSHHFTAPIFSYDPATEWPDVSCSVDWRAHTYSCDTVYEIRSSPDQKTLYVGGDFAKVNGRDRRKLAAFSTATGSLDPAFVVMGTSYRVLALAVTASTLYVGGHFLSTSGSPRQRLAAFDRVTGALKPWAPRADNTVRAMVMSPDNSRVILGGHFAHLNDTEIRGLGAVDALTGATTRWDSRPIGPDDYVTDLVADRDTVYASSNGEGEYAFDGRLAADPYTGVLRWVDNCRGATWALSVMGDVLYSGSHAHNCWQTDGGFPAQARRDDPSPRWFRLLAQTTRGPRTTLQHWYPSTNGGDPGLDRDRTIARLGPRALANDGKVLWVGGQFTTVNEQAQQGLTRFAIPPAAGSAPQRPARPTAVRGPSGSVIVSWPAVEDLDSPTLTYLVYRNGYEIARRTADSAPWDTPMLTIRDAVPLSNSVSYHVIARDPDGNTSPRSASVRLTW